MSAENAFNLPFAASLGWSNLSNFTMDESLWTWVSFFENNQWKISNIIDDGAYFLNHCVHFWCNSVYQQNSTTYSREWENVWNVRKCHSKVKGYSHIWTKSLKNKMTKR